MAVKDDLTNDLFWLAALAAGGYLLWTYFLKAPAQAVTQAAGAAVNAVSSPIANLWLTLNPLPQGPGVLGTVQLPDGTEIATSSLQLRTDAAGNVYTQVSGVTYQLAPWVLDSAGNPVYPATAVG